MNLSNSGRIVLIDDKLEDALPLMETLGRYGIPYLYYDGKLPKMPDSPPRGIRFVFLDIELSGTEGKDEKTKASALIGCLKKVISDLNGPYVIIFWTRHKEVIEQVIKNCTTAKIPPVSWLDLEKNEFKKMDGSYDIESLSEKLRDRLLKTGAFRLYVEWENILHAASEKFICGFSNLVHPGEKWSIDTSALFYKLYKAYVEDDDITDKTEQFRCACLLMNLSFLDTLQSISAKALHLPDEFKLAGGDIGYTTLAKLNTSLFLNKSLLSRPSTGYVYSEKHEESKHLKDSLVESLFKKNPNPPAEIQLCKIIITPGCDLAHGKILRHQSEKGKHKVHRIVYGLLFPVVAGQDHRGKGDAQFNIGAIWHEEKAQFLVLNFSTISFQQEGELLGDPLFAVGRELLFDIQSKAANHVNRLGNFQLG